MVLHDATKNNMVLLGARHNMVLHDATKHTMVLFGATNHSMVLQVAYKAQCCATW